MKILPPYKVSMTLWDRSMLHLCTEALDIFQALLCPVTFIPVCLVFSRYVWGFSICTVSVHGDNDPVYYYTFCHCSLATHIYNSVRTISCIVQMTITCSGTCACTSQHDIQAFL